MTEGRESGGYGTSNGSGAVRANEGASKSIDVFGLLAVSPNSGVTGVNFGRRADPLLSYCLCAELLARSLGPAGLRLTILSNDPDLILRTMFDCGVDPTFSLQLLEMVPRVSEGVAFRMAHNKVDVFRYIGSSSVEVAIFADLDVVFIGATAGRLRCLLDRVPLGYYDILDQVLPVYGYERISSDLRRVGGAEVALRWCGGEFIVGDADFFGRLASNFERSLERYVGSEHRYHHQGDEMLLSGCVLSSFDGREWTECGSAGLVARFWSVATRHRQIRFSAARECDFLHLPADKEFLSSYVLRSEGSFDREDFLASYRVWLARRFPRRVSSRLVRRLTRH